MGKQDRVTFYFDTIISLLANDKVKCPCVGIKKNEVLQWVPANSNSGHQDSGK